MTRLHTPTWLFALALSAAAACGAPAPLPTVPTAPSATPAPSASTAPAPTSSVAPTTSASAAPSASAPAIARPAPGKMLPVTRTEFGDKLKALGLDVKNLPPLRKMDPLKRRLVMDYVSEATGADCMDCHASEEDLKAMTPRKNVGLHMWDDWTRGFTTADGGPVFCDSCHHGSLTVLDRRDTQKVAEWMKTSLVAKLARKDKKKIVCEQCHGEPFDSSFLEKWRSGHP